MEKDFHYCLIRVLAGKAGFNREEAQVIAYASQYVDDSVENQPLSIDNIPDLVFPRLNVENGTFDPICTAHRGIQYLTGMTKHVQMKVYIPFHFIPPVEYSGNGAYEYCTSPNSTIAGDLVRHAITELKDDGSNRVQKLVKLGIALHSFADTWAHQRFSGRWSARDNDIDRIALFRNKKWKALKHLDRLKTNIMPDVGHAEAMTYPDQSHLKWRYEHGHSGLDHERNNTLIFLEAGHAVFQLLCDAAGTSGNWKEHLEKIRKCLSVPADSVKRKFFRYVKLFPEISFSYHENEWRESALEGERFNWIDFSRDDYSGVTYTFKGSDLRWFYFHMEAYAQREYVKSKIKGDLL